MYMTRLEAFWHQLRLHEVAFVSWLFYNTDGKAWRCLTCKPVVRRPHIYADI